MTLLVKSNFRTGINLLVFFLMGIMIAKICEAEYPTSIIPKCGGLYICLFVTSSRNK